MTRSERLVRSAIQNLEESGEGDFVGPMPESLIARAEAVLGLAFPAGYREFVAELGCGDVGGREFYGLIGEPVDKGPIPNVVWYTKQLRQDALSKFYIPVYEPGDGTIYILDSTNLEEELLMWLPGAPDAEPLGQTFGELFLDAVVSQYSSGSF